MPTATSLSGYGLINNGPLTTTFTAPASCSTPYDVAIAPSLDPSFFQWDAQCDVLPPADCNPAGSVLRSLVSSAEGSNPTAGMFIVYHSPGLVCPSGWSTVGVATKVSPTSMSISGAFNQSMNITNDYLGFEPQMDIMLAALDPGETAAACCPSGYATMDNVCFSALPTSVYTVTSACQRRWPVGDLGSVNGTWTFGEQRVTGKLDTITGTTPIYTATTAFPASEATSYVGVAVSDMFILVHQASDTAAASTAKQTKASSSSSSKTNAAGSLKMTLHFTAKMCFLSLALGLCMGI